MASTVVACSGGLAAAVGAYAWWRRSQPVECNVILIRHGESTVNKSGRYESAEFFDAPLTPHGRAQASENMQAELKHCLRADDNSVRVIVVSTLTRTLETATHGILPILPPCRHTSWIALDCVRESTAAEVSPCEKNVDYEKPCNLRGPLEVVLKTFPHIDFSLCTEKDPLERIETIKMVDRRVEEFGTWLRQWVRQQRKLNGSVQLDVIVVSHYVFLHRLLSAVERRGGSPGGPLGFENCEVRKFPLDSFLGQ